MRMQLPRPWERWPAAGRRTLDVRILAADPRSLGGTFGRNL